MYEADLCDGCNLPTRVRTDPSNHFQIEHDKCPVCASVAKYGRMQAAADKASVEQRFGENTPPPSVDLPGDGRSVRLRPVPPALEPAVEVEVPEEHHHQ